MRHTAEVGDAVAIKQFMFHNRDGHQKFVNETIISSSLKYTGPCVVLMVKAWEDDECGWRYHAVPVNIELVEFLESHGSVPEPVNKVMCHKLYVGEFDIDWKVNATAIIEQDIVKRRQLRKQS